MINTYQVVSRNDCTPRKVFHNEQECVCTTFVLAGYRPI